MVSDPPEITQISLDLHRGLGNRFWPLLSGLAMLQGSPRITELRYAWNLYQPPQSMAPWPDPPYPFQTPMTDLFRIRDPRAREVAPGELWRRRQDPGTFHVPNHIPFRPQKECERAVEQLLVAPEPSQRIRDLIGQMDRRGGPVVGVSLRQLCAWFIYSQTPIDWYVKRLQELSREVRGLQIYVSADTTEGRQVMERTFPGRVLTQKKPATTYSSPEGIVSGFVDMAVLSACSHVLGPPGSSFAFLAHWMRGRPQSTYESSRNNPPRGYLENLKSCRTFSTRLSLSPTSRAGSSAASPARSAAGGTGSGRRS